jgi:hypothetical protein
MASQATDGSDMLANAGLMARLSDEKFYQELKGS